MDIDSVGSLKLEDTYNKKVYDELLRNHMTFLKKCISEELKYLY